MIAVTAAPTKKCPASTTPKIFDKIVLFGDSLSDNGNGTSIITDGRIPGDAYYQGRFSNGPTWVEYLSDKLGTTHENYACGGATVDDTLVQGWVGGKFNEPDPPTNVTGVRQQIDVFTATKQPSAEKYNPEKTLYVVWAGNNDMFDIDLLKLNIMETQVLDALQNVWTILHTSPNIQARHFLLITSMGDNSTLPGDWTNMAEKFLNRTQQFEKTYPKTTVATFNMGDWRRTVDLNSVGITNSTDSCLGKGFTLEGGVCDNPENYWKWDPVGHPTTRVHELIASGVEEVMKKVWNVGRVAERL